MSTLRRSSRIRTTLTQDNKSSTERKSISTELHIVDPPCTALRKNMRTINQCNQSDHVALFLVGPAGSGKTSLYAFLDIPQERHQYYNIDTYQEILLWKNNALSLDTSARFSSNMKEKLHELLTSLQRQAVQAHEVYSATELDKRAKTLMASLTSKLMAKAKKCMDEDYQTFVNNCENLIIDKPGDNVTSIITMKRELESKGYRTIMVMVYAPLEDAIRRDNERYRRLGPSVVKSIWMSVTKHIPRYQKEFGKDFYVINNSEEEVSIKGVHFTNKDEVKRQMNALFR